MNANQRPFDHYSATAMRTAALLLLALSFPNGTTAFGQCSFEGLGQLPGLAFGSGSSVAAVSANGQVVVGFSFSPPSWPSGSPTRQFRWTPEAGMVGLFPPALGNTSAVSSDGSVVVGTFSLDSYGGGFRWTAGGGVVPITSHEVRGVSGNGSVLVGGNGTDGPPVRWLPPWSVPQFLVPANDPTRGKALAASWDGAVVVGWRYVFPSESFEPFRWTANKGIVGLGTLGGSGGNGDNGAANAVSSDGSVVVGHAASAAADQIYEAFRWTEASGMEGLGFLPGAFLKYSKAFGVSGDGNIVVGEATGRVEEGKTIFVWTQGQGMRRLSDILSTDCNLDLADWYLRGGTHNMTGSELRVGISADGTTIVGTGMRPNYVLEAFRARIPRGFADCNHNGTDDAAELAQGTATDCNGNGRPDECDIEQCADDSACSDCNTNRVPDGCDITAGTSTDANGNGVPDECDGCCAGCDDGSVCTSDTCAAGVCKHVPVLYGDLHPCGGNGIIDFDDLLAVLNAFVGSNPCECAP